MKNSIKSLLTAGILLAAIGCSKDQTVSKFDPAGEDASTAYFAQKGFTEEFGTDLTGDQTLSVDIYRQNNRGETTVGLYYTLSDESAPFFVIPDEVTFRDGEYKTSIPVTVRNVQDFSKGKSYTATISVGDHHEFTEIGSALKLDRSAARRTTRAISVPRYESITLSTALTLDWQPTYILKDPSKLLEEKPAGTADKDWYVMGDDGKPKAQTATWIDAWGMTTGTEGLTVQRAAGTNVFRILNCGDGGVNIIFTVDEDPTHQVTYEGKKYFRCVLTAQDAGVDYADTGDDIYIADFASYTGKESLYDTAPCFWDGAYEFDFTLYWHVPALGGGFTDPAGGLTDAFVFDSGAAADPEPEVEITYVGLQTSQTGVRSHSLRFEPGSDAASYYATVLKENVEAIDVPDSAVDLDEIAAMTEAYLTQGGLTPDDPNWRYYYIYYYNLFLDEAKAEVYEELLKASLEEKLPPIREEIEKGTYAGPFAVIEATEKSEQAWELGTERGVYTAVAFSYDKSGQFKGIDYKVFIYNPAGDPDAVEFTLDCDAGGEYADPSMGYFGDNSVNFRLQAPNGDLTSVRYVFLTEAEFVAAGLNDEEVLAYIEANGRSLNAEALDDANGEDGFSTWLAAEPATKYHLLMAVSNPDATGLEMYPVTTEAAETPKELTCTLSLPNAAGRYWQHTHVYAAFTGTHITGGSYLIAPVANKTIAAYFSVSPEGAVTLNQGVTDADAIALIEENGTAFTTGEEMDDPTESDLYALNSGEGLGVFLAAEPETPFIVLAAADQTGKGANVWTASVITTDFAPPVSFEQTVTVSGNNLQFNWSAAPTASIFAVEKVVYARVPVSALTDAGVDMTLLSDEALNDFDARKAAAVDENERIAIDREQKNAEKVREVLNANAKVFQGDAAARINAQGGVSKQFEGLAPGEYALIALANDAYNTRLCVDRATIR